MMNLIRRSWIVAVLILLFMAGSVWSHPKVEVEVAVVDVPLEVGKLGQNSREAKAASRRLAAHGARALPLLHAALLAPSTHPLKRAQIISVLGEIADPESVPVLLQTLERFPSDTLLVSAALVELPYLSDEPVAFVLAKKILDSAASHPGQQSRALSYLGQVRDPRAKPYVAKFQDSDSLDVRLGTYWLAARLNLAEAKSLIGKEFAKRPHRRYHRSLLLCLAEAVSPGEFGELAPVVLKETIEYSAALSYAEFRVGQGESRIAAAQQVMNSPFRFERVQAALHLVEALGAERMAREHGSAGRSSGQLEITRHALRRSGRTVETTSSELRLVPGGGE